MINLSGRKVVQSVAAGLCAGILVSAIAVLQPSANAVSGGDCDANAVIYCGASNASEVVSAYNAKPGVRVIYTYFGISRSDVESLGSTSVMGSVTRLGQVLVNGKVVATHAVTAGRQNISGSTAVTRNGMTFYTRTPSVSFRSSPLSAFVVMQNGVFQFAILTSCGNPVKATPYSVPATPKPTTTKPKVITKTITKKVVVPSTTTVVNQNTNQNVNNNNVEVKQVTQPTETKIVYQESKPKVITKTVVQRQKEIVYAQPTPQPAPVKSTEALPNTGPGNVLGLGAAVSVAGGLAHYVYSRRKLV